MHVNFDHDPRHIIMILRAFGQDPGSTFQLRSIEEVLYQVQQGRGVGQVSFGGSSRPQERKTRCLGSRSRGRGARSDMSDMYDLSLLPWCYEAVGCALLLGPSLPYQGP